MKKFTSLLIVCLIFIYGAFAQTPQNRTVSTIVADALAQLPSNTSAKYNEVMSGLISSGEDGLLILINKMNPPGLLSNETVEFAISGWANTVANDPTLRLIAANTFEKALSLSLDKDTKAFLIRQLQLVENDENVDVLSSFLTDIQLCYPASQALIALHSEKAIDALLKALTAASSEEFRICLVNALGQSDDAKAEPVLVQMLNNNPSDDLKYVLLKALSHVGTQASLGVLKTAAELVNYTYQRNDVTFSYIQLLKKVALSNPGFAQIPANNLFLTATKLNKPDLQVAATEILMSLPSTNKLKILKMALSSGSPVYVASTLNAYPFQNETKSLDLIIHSLSKSIPEVQTVILYWLGSQKVEKYVPEISKFLGSSDTTLQTAAVRSLSEMGGASALKELVQLLKSTDSNLLSQTQIALLSYDGDLSGPLAKVFDEASSEGKVVALQIMATRRMINQYQLVVNQLQASDVHVQDAALQALKEVVTEKNIPELFSLLEKTDAKKIPFIQEAINAALSNLSTAQQMALVAEKMNQSAKSFLYYSALASIGTKSALEIVTKAYQSQNETTKLAAFDALAKWKTFEVIYPLLDIARSVKTKEELQKTTDVLVFLITNANQTGAVNNLFLQEVMSFAQTDQQKNEILRLLGNCNTYQALLFVEPFMEVPTLRETAAQAAMALALNNSSFAGEKTTSILEKVSTALNNPDAGYQREAIKKYLSENPVNGGFISIFNGKDLDGWKGLVGNPLTRAKMNAKELTQAQAKADEEAAKNWLVENGELVFTGNGENLCTTKKYGDFEMLVDWKLLPGNEPDAGIYLRGTPQVQIWDTARVNVGAQVGSGGLYNNQTNTSKPLQVADLKVGEWNTFHIKMIGDRVTVYLNGILVTDNVMMENYWDKNLPIFPLEQIELQAHGSKVCYRNLFIKEIARPEPFKLSKEDVKEGYKVLFDGTNMHEWIGNTTEYITEDGNMVIYPSESFGGNLYTRNEYGDFVFRFEFQLTPGANNGLGIRTPMDGDAAYVGMELQILDNEDPIYKDLNAYQYHGSVYGVIASKRGFLKPVGEWNYQEVIAKGDNIKVILNGTVILDGNIREAAKNGTIDKKEHPGLFNKKGHIGFLGHGSVVKFRNIRVKEL